MTIEISNPNRIPRDFCIFFCWQDHIDPALHRHLIRECLERAIGQAQAALPEDLECTLRLDQATDDRSGAVEIANSILEKILTSVMVVADVTPTRVDCDPPRMYPNPNVMLEVGYAARSLGWNRVNCLFNSVACNPESLPFDIRHRRASPYRCSTREERGEARNHLTQLLVAAIRATILSIDRGEIDETIGNEQIRHARDLRVVGELMLTIHRPTLDRFIERGLEYQVHYDCIYFWHGFEALVCSSFFRLYDRQLQTLVERLYDVWGAAIYHGSYAFGPGSIPGSLVLKPDHLWNEEYEQTVRTMEQAYIGLRPALNAVLDHIHGHFLEIDMDETDRQAYEINRRFIEGTVFGGDESETDAAEIEDYS